MGIQVMGIYDKTIYRDEKSASTIFSFKTKDPLKEQNHYGCIACIGKIPVYEKGMPLLVEGDWKISEEYGPQLLLTRVREYSWSEAAAIEYLATGNFKGISYATSRELVAKMGPDIFQIAMQPSAAKRISRCVRSLSEKNAIRLCEAIKATVHQRELFEYLVRYGGTWVAAERLFREYGANALPQLRQTPYVSGMAHGLDFYTCDRIAKAEGFHAASGERITAVIKTAMRKLNSAGHVYALQNQLCRTAYEVMKRSSFPNEDIPSSLLVNAMVKDKDIVIEEDVENRIYTEFLYEAERNVAKQVQRLIRARRPLPYQESLIIYAEEQCNRKFQGQQRKSFDLIRKSGIGILTGGPGTGKTTCVSGLMAAFEKMIPNARILLCAPTGRAAQRLAESTGREAVTIHRLLEYRPYGERLIHKNIDNPLDADLLIVDEGSMLSCSLASVLLSAVRSGALVIIIGDINQLPSVEPGEFLHDLIFSGLVPVCQLREVHRQAAGSSIICNADLINDGFTELVEDERFHIQYAGNQTGIADQIVEAVKALYNPKTPFDTQVLAPVYRDDAGIGVLNKRLQDLLNPGRGEKEIRYGDRTFRCRDKVILLSNNYVQGYYNGDIGQVSEIGNSCLTVQLANKQICLSHELMDDIDLAYCISVHRSQGSEFTNVIFSLPNTRNLMKNLLYTGITRAKERVILVAQNGAVYAAIQNSSFGVRNSYLIPRMHMAFKLCA